MSNTFRGRVLGYEIQHIFPSEIMASITPEALKAKAVLAKISFNIDARSNKIALLISPSTIDEVHASSPQIQQEKPCHRHYADHTRQCHFYLGLTSITIDNSAYVNAGKVSRPVS